MRTRVLTFIDALRNTGLSISVAESLDAMQAVAAVGVERSAFREGLAAALVKDEADRPAFDAVFDRFFAAPGRPSGRGKQPRASEEEAGHGGIQGSGGTSPLPEHRLEESTRQRPSDHQRHQVGEPEPARRAANRLTHQRELRNTPFREMSAQEIEECDALVSDLAHQFRAHVSRRQRAARRGRLDVRRTIHRSISRGGVPIEPAFRQRQPGRPDLLALCDHSHSVATASHFLLGLLTPAQEFFRRVRLFAFVDQPVEVSVESGALVPHEPLDLYAHSDLGKVLVGLWERHAHLLTRNTIFLILGDARNNRKPPRADLLGRIHAAVKQVVWLNPEPLTRWNTGDSVINAYQRHCDAVISASTVNELYTRLRRLLRAA